MVKILYQRLVIIFKYSFNLNESLIQCCSTMIELNFWNNRLKNLTQIYEQLKSEKIHSMAIILESTDSAYFPCFRTMFKNVVTGECPHTTLIVQISKTVCFHKLSLNLRILPFTWILCKSILHSLRRWTLQNPKFYWNHWCMSSVWCGLIQDIIVNHQNLLFCCVKFVTC